MEDTEQVRLQHFAELLLAELLHRADERVAGVVDHDIQPTESLLRRRDGLEHLRPLGDVHPKRQHRVAEPIDEVGQCRGVQGGGGDLVAALQRGEGELAAETARRTGDEPDFCS